MVTIENSSAVPLGLNENIAIEPVNFREFFIRHASPDVRLARDALLETCNSYLSNQEVFRIEAYLYSYWRHSHPNTGSQ